MNPSDFPLQDFSDIEDMELLPGGNTILFQGEVLCLRFLTCLTCGNINAMPIFINLSKQEERLKEISQLIAPCPDCTEEKYSFLSLEEIKKLAIDDFKQDHSDDFDGD